jgi:hypothetical protein
MTTGKDQAAGPRPTRRLLSSIRDVLFENTSPAPGLVSTNAISIAAPASSDVDAARSVLRAAIEAQLGPGIREFSLQNEALSEALPDVSVRRHAALRVLALKGTTREHLCTELEHALATLDAQSDAFARKLRDRRDALDASQRGDSAQCHRETNAAEQTIARLQAELDAQRTVIIEAQSRRDEALRAAQVALAELATREQAFQSAFGEVHGEYIALRAQLSRESV